jgi:hypothetical protein
VNIALVAKLADSSDGRPPEQVVRFAVRDLCPGSERKPE